jgi:L-ascorbate metabolism protein UlaG (beta-lactamase superfamily)
MRVTYIGQSTVVVEADGQAIIIDPAWRARLGPFFLATAPYRQAGRTLRERHFNGVLLTHLHLDHTEPRTLNSLRRALEPAAPLVFPALARPFLKRGRDPLTRLADFRSAQLLAFAELPAALIECARYLDQGATMQLGPFTITAVPMDHDVKIHGVAPIGSGYVIRADGQTLYHAGDSILNEQIASAVAAACGRPDLLLVPIGFPRTKRNHPHEAAKLTAAVQPYVVTPMHYGMPSEEPEDGGAAFTLRAGKSPAGIPKPSLPGNTRAAAIGNIDLALTLPGMVRPISLGTAPEFAAELQAQNASARLCILKRLESLDLGEI